MSLPSEDIELILETRKIALDALNHRNFDQVKPYLHPDFTITTVDNQVFHGVEDFQRYWENQFQTKIKSITMTLDEHTDRVLLAPNLEVAYGAATSTFNFKNGKNNDMPLRWTAVLQKANQRWLIQSLHFSANLLDNPVLAVTQSAMRWSALVAGVVGIVVGAAAIWFWKP